MKKLMAVVVASMFVTAGAYAQQQTGSMPPEQAPAGNPGKFTKPTRPEKAADTSATTDTSAAPTTKAERRANRKAKRAAKVGDKPIN